MKKEEKPNFRRKSSFREELDSWLVAFGLVLVGIGILYSSLLLSLQLDTCIDSEPIKTGGVISIAGLVCIGIGLFLKYRD